MPRIETGENPTTGLGGLESLKALKAMQIDQETSAAILAGFAYEVNGGRLHFSYDVFDQQNFSDAANNALAALMAKRAAIITWNGYDETRTPVRLELPAADFLALYQEGACAHKLAQMAEARRRKALLADPATDTPQKVEAV